MKKCFLILLFFAFIDKSLAGTVSSLTREDIYEVLIKTKDDKIILLNNIVTWLLAVASISVTLIVVFFGWLLKKLSNRVDQADKLINNLTNIKNEIVNDQEKIKLILSSKEFQEKLKQFEENLYTLNNSVRRWEQYEDEIKSRKVREKRSMLESSIQTYILIAELNDYKGRMNEEEKNEYDQRLKIWESDRFLDINDLQDLSNFLLSVYNRYHLPDDKPPI